MGITPFYAKGMAYTSEYRSATSRSIAHYFYVLLLLFIVGRPTRASSALEQTAETWLRAFDLAILHNQRQSGAVGAAAQHDEATMHGGWWPAHL